MKKLKPHPSHTDFINQWSSIYTDHNYDQSLSGKFLSASHHWAEQNFPKTDHYEKVLEVGAGTGTHIFSVEHQCDEYWITDLNEEMLSNPISDEKPINIGKVLYAVEDASKLSFEDNSFDRLIAAHVLEHLPNPHLVLSEWARVVRPGGYLTILLPCDPGAGWRLGRSLMVRQKFKALGFDYDYWMAREHINSINNLVALIRFYFTDIEESWKPLAVPSIDLNLFYIVNIRL